MPCITRARSVSIWGEPAQRRAQGEGGDAGQEQAGAAQNVAEQAEGQQAQGESEDIGGNHPFDLVSVGVKSVRIEGSATLTMVTSIRFMKLAISSTKSASQRRGSASSGCLGHGVGGIHFLSLFARVGSMTARSSSSADVFKGGKLARIFAPERLQRGGDGVGGGTGVHAGTPAGAGDAGAQHLVELADPVAQLRLDHRADWRRCAWRASTARRRPGPIWAWSPASRDSPRN